MKETVTQEEFDNFKLKVINFINGLFKEGIAMYPTVFLKPFNKRYKTAPLPNELFETEQRKDIAAETIKDMVKTAESPMMCFATEAWSAKMDRENYDPDNIPRPSQLPEDQRDEVVFLTFEAIDKPSYLMSFLKIKNEDGSFKLKVHPIMSDTKMNDTTRPEGRFVNFYSKV